MDMRADWTGFRIEFQNRVSTCTTVDARDFRVGHQLLLLAAESPQEHQRYREALPFAHDPLGKRCKTGETRLGFRSGLSHTRTRHPPSTQNPESDPIRLDKE